MSKSLAPHLRAVYKGHSEFVSAVAFSPDARYVVSGGFDGQGNCSVGLCDLEHGAEFNRIRVPLINNEPQAQFAVIDRICFLAPDQFVICVGEVVYVLDLAGHLVRCLEPETEPEMIGLSGDGRTLAVLDSDDRVRLLTAGSFEELHAFPLPFSNAHRLAVSYDGSKLAISAGEGLLVVAHQGKALVNYPSRHVHAFAFGPWRDRLALVPGDMNLNVIEVGSTRMAMGQQLLGNLCDCVGVSGGGQLIATGSGWGPCADEEQKGRLSIWRSDTLEEAVFAEALGSRIWSVAFSADDKLLAAAEDNGFVRVWQLDGMIE